MKKQSLIHPEVNFSDEGLIRHLHLDSPWIQGSMRMDAPIELVHEYIQRMMAWLLFVDADTVPKRQALQLGLGAGSLTKHCHKVLRMKTTAIELNPQVYTPAGVGSSCPLTAHACRSSWPMPRRRFSSPAGGVRWMPSKWICTTMTPPPPCWTAQLFMPTAAAC